MASNATTNISVEPDIDKISFILELYSEGPLRIEITEDITISSGGGAISLVNMERSGTYSTDVEVAPLTAFTGGTSLLTSKIPGSVSGSTVKFSGDAGLILKESTIYAYEFQNLSNSPALVNINWYLREIK
jgi:hypothetical protein